MDLNEAIMSRHSVRNYTDREIEEEKLAELYSEIYLCNTEGKLNIQMITNEPNAFDGFIAHYSNFSGVANYMVLIGPKNKDLDEKIGYYGERLVLKAQQLGLNTCWVALTFNKGKTEYRMDKDEKLVCVITLGYGKTQGVPHKNRQPLKLFYRAKEEPPEWFMNGVKAAVLAPTAMNQQKFVISLIDDKTVDAKSKIGPYTKVDLGIIKYHFEIGAGEDTFEWK